MPTLAVIGLGLIGSSIARAVAARGLAQRIIGIDRSADVCARAVEIGLGDEVRPLDGDAARGADLVVLAVPLGAMGDVVRAIRPSLDSMAVVTDVGSSKQSVLRDMADAMLRPERFVAGHPIAGTEQSGPDAGFSTLFDGRWCILTPDTSTDENALTTVRRFWEALGSTVETMDAAHHDLVLATTSHLPHLIAYNIVGTAADLEDITRSEVIKFSAGGFRDFTRLAASDPVMWRDVCLNNRDALLQMLDNFSSDLADLRASVAHGDGDALFELFARTRAIRRGIIDAGQEVAGPDFGRLEASAGRPAKLGPVPSPYAAE
ncbi:MAG: prephenate/arogenate dehydrogenase family protein [Pseudomonadota bacterium]